MSNIHNAAFGFCILKFSTLDGSMVGFFYCLETLFYLIGMERGGPKLSATAGKLA